MSGLPRLNPRLAQTQKLLADYLTPDQLAAELGIRPSTLKRWDRLGQAPPKTMIGRFPFYLRSSMVEWLKTR